MEKILITGANGLIGKHLTQLLAQQGYEVHWLVRKIDASSPVKQHSWNPEKGELDAAIFNGMDHLIHLAGSNISAGRWTQKRRHEMRASRIDTMNLLFEQSANANLKTVISASGISIYGNITSEKIFTEEDEPKTDFLAQLTIDWEKASDAFASRNVRVVKFRTAVVLAPDGGALQRIAGPVRKGFGTVLGSGKQYFPWIHIDDLCLLYVAAIQNSTWYGTYNAVAPEHATNKILTQKIGETLGKKIRLPAAPAFVLKMVFGEMSGLILKGSRISSEKITRAGFIFNYPNLTDALKSCLKK